MIYIEKEIWKPIKESDNKYEISNLGNVRNIRLKNNIKYRLDRYGYPRIGFRNKKGKRIYMFVHRLIAIYFIDNPNNYPIVNHKNGIVTDFRIENLEWCTYKYNTRHSYDVLNRKGQCGDQNIKIRITKDNEIKEYFSMKEASLELGYNEQFLYQTFRKFDNKDCIEYNDFKAEKIYN